MENYNIRDKEQYKEAYKEMIILNATAIARKQARNQQEKEIDSKELKREREQLNTACVKLAAYSDFISDDDIRFIKEESLNELVANETKSLQKRVLCQIRCSELYDVYHEKLLEAKSRIEEKEILLERKIKDPETIDKIYAYIDDQVSIQTKTKKKNEPPINLPKTIEKDQNTLEMINQIISERTNQAALNRNLSALSAEASDEGYLDVQKQITAINTTDIIRNMYIDLLSTQHSTTYQKGISNSINSIANQAGLTNQLKEIEEEAKQHVIKMHSIRKQPPTFAKGNSLEVHVSPQKHQMPLVAPQHKSTNSPKQRK